MRHRIALRPGPPASHPFRWAYVDVLLGELGEPSLRPLNRAGGEAYRVVIATSFDGTAVVRLDVLPDGGGTLQLWNPDGYCSNVKASRAESRTTILGVPETDSLRGVLQEAAFWTLGATDGPSSLDGTDWYVEGVREGEHRIVLRSSPGGGALPRVAESFSAAAGCEHRPPKWTESGGTAP